MNYIERTLEQTITEASAAFKVVLLTGPRQVGKTTLLRKLKEPGRSYVSLDEPDTRFAAKRDPAGFISRLRLPVLIDEVQYVPELFPYIKAVVDRAGETGLVWLTGSQQFSMMKNVSESLAGRVAILDLQGISLAEEQGRPGTPPFIPTVEVLRERERIARPLGVEQVFEKIWRGSYPHVVSDRGRSWHRFYQSYVSTYIERDVRDYLKIDDLMSFHKFIQVAAARTGQMLNYREVSKDAGVSEPTVKSWFNVLRATGLVTILQPYFKNTAKRLLKTPKFYFMDTGLCCFLTRWTNPEVLEKGAMAGAILETYAVSEIIKSHIHNGSSDPVYYYADKEKREVDILIERDGRIHPVEIKKTASVRNSGFRGFDFLRSVKTPVGHGCVLCFHEEFLPFSREVDIVPIGYL